MTLSPHKGKPPSIPPKGGGKDDPQPPKRESPPQSPQRGEEWMTLSPHKGLRVGLWGLISSYRAYGAYRAYGTYMKAGNAAYTYQA